MQHKFGDDINQEVIDLIWGNTTDAIFTICNKGTVKHVNPAFEEMFGWDLEELKNLIFPPMIIDQTREEHEAFLKKLKAGNHVPYTVVKRQTKAGKKLDILASYRAVNKGDLLAVAMYKDFTGQLQIQDKLEESEYSYRTLVEYLPEAVIRLRFDKIEFINSAGMELFGQKSKEAVIGKTIWHFVESVEQEKIDHLISGACKKSTGKNMFVGKLKRLDGKEIWSEIKVIPVGKKDDPDTQIVIQNVTERKLYESKLEYLAYHDPLTGLKNRRIFTDIVNETSEEAMKTGERIAMMYIDLDKFKMINDIHGHDVGDQLLLCFAQRLERSVKSGDVLCRVGGDEFLALLRNVDDEAQITKIAKRMTASFQAPYNINGLRLDMTASIGISILPDDAIGAKALIFRADEALYQAKKERNQFQFYKKDKVNLFYFHDPKK